MGLFDYLRFESKRHLPNGAPTEGYQTKDTPTQLMEVYEVRDDGSLWHESIKKHVRDEPDSLFGIVIERVGSQWRAQDWTGEVVALEGEWCFSLYFVRGWLCRIETLDKPDSVPDG